MTENNIVQIPLDVFLELTRKSEQRDVILRYAAKQEYSVYPKELFNICGEELPKKEAENE